MIVAENCSNFPGSGGGNDGGVDERAGLGPKECGFYWDWDVESAWIIVI